ncbi:MAG: hypothetical protein FWC76_05240 [Defluviitaleaceae bacterium]|nr:hypothetical protein [Defluviitaleaceae bacterium]
MKNLKRFLAATLVMTALFATSVLAQSPREILSQANANSADITVFGMSGHIAMNISVDDALMQLNMDLDMLFDMDIEADTMTMYIRMPMSISVEDPATGEAFDESVNMVMFMDETGMFTYVEGIGWFTDPSMDMAAGMGMGNFNEMMQWSLELDEMMLDMMELEFAAVQPEGYYVIESVMDMDDLMDVIGTIFTSDFFLDIMAFTPEADMSELTALLDDIDIGFEMISRTYIDVETVNIQRYAIDITFAMDLDLGILGNLNMSGDMVMVLDVDLEPTIAWPVIDEVISLADIIGDTDELFFNVPVTMDAIELTFGEEDLEERAAWTISDGPNSVLINLVADYDANFNIWIVNHGDADISVMLASVFNVVIQPGQSFVIQIPAGDVGAILIDGGTSSIEVETGFRLTNYPLS